MILVFGATGVTGGEVARQLIAAGQRPRLFVRRGQGLHAYRPRVPQRRSVRGHAVIGPGEAGEVRGRTSRGRPRQPAEQRHASGVRRCPDGADGRYEGRQDRCCHQLSEEGDRATGGDVRRLGTAQHRRLPVIRQPGVSLTPAHPSSLHQGRAPPDPRGKPSAVEAPPPRTRPMVAAKISRALTTA